MRSRLGIIMAVAMGMSALETLVPQAWPPAAHRAQAQTVEDKIKAVIAEHLGVNVGKVTPGARFKEDLGADDLDIVELTMAFEEAFRIEIADADAETFIRVDDVIRYLRAKVK